MKRMLAYALALVSAFCASVTPALAQTATIGGSSGGGNAVVTDSLKRLANGTAAAPPLAFLNSTGTGLYRFGADTLGFATGGAASLGIRGGASPTIFGGAGNMTIQAGTGASRTLTLQTTNSGSSVQTGARFLADSAQLWTGGFASITITGANAPIIRGSNGNMEIRGGNNSGSITLGTKNSAGSDFSLLRLRAAGAGAGGQVAAGVNGSLAAPVFTATGDTSTGMWFRTDSLRFSAAGAEFALGRSDTLIIASKSKAPSLTAAAGTPNTLCINATTKELTENAATDCTVSAARFKLNIQSLSPTMATRSIMALRPSQWTYRDGGRRAVGLIADNVDSVDARLGFRNPDGRINSYDQAGVIGLLVATVQEQQRAIAAINRGLAVSTERLRKLCAAGVQPAC